MKVRDLLMKMSSFSKRTWIIFGSSAGLLILLLIFFIPKPLNIAAVTVERSEFIVDINLRGEIDALNSINISVPRMRRRFSLQIVDMVDEGTIVKKGDFILQLDNSDALQNVDEAKDQLENAYAQLESEKANIESNKAQLKSQLENQEYSYEQAELNLRMMKYEAESRRQEANLNMKKAMVLLDQAKEKITSQKVIDNATMKRARLEVKQATVELKESEQTLEKLRITAPADGMVVYRETFTGSGMKKIQIGDTPFPGMPVMSIPDLSVMKGKVTVNERYISKIKKNLNVIISVDALEGKGFYGNIYRVATLARRESSTNAKVFDIEVKLDSTRGELRPGMTCDCRIIVNRITDVLKVPLQSVFQKEDRTIVYVAGRWRAREREVDVGIKSSDYIVIRKGLEEGEKVCLRDPTIPLEEMGGETEISVSNSNPTKSTKKKSSRSMMIIH